MKIKPNKALLLLAVASGLLLGAAYPPVPAGLTAFVAFIPFLALMEKMKSAAQAFRYSYLTFLVLNITTIYWISGWWGEDIWLKLAGIAVNLVHPFYFTVPALLYYLVRRRKGLLWGLFSFPCIWVLYEWTAHLPELSFPWLLLANTQTYAIEKIQFISYTGAFGISFWITLTNVLLYLGFIRTVSGEWRIRSRKAVFLLISVILLIGVPEIVSRLLMKDIVQGRSIKIGIAQPDIDPYDKWSDGETAEGKLRNLCRLYDSCATLADPDIIFFPETAIPFLLFQPSYYEEYKWLKHHVDSVGVPLLTGFPDIVWYTENAPPGAKSVQGDDMKYNTFNSVLLLIPGENDPQIYHKSKLTPLSERIPYLDELPFLGDLLTWGVGISSWGLGNDTTVFRMSHGSGEVKLWAMICYETLYPDFVAGFTRRGAGLLGVITNDGWFGNSSGPYQLMRYAVLRAIENRRAIARCANNGISCFIDPYGRVSQETTFAKRTWIAAEVPIRTETTFYSAHGDWLAHLCSILALLSISAAVLYPDRRQDIQ